MLILLDSEMNFIVIIRFGGTMTNQLSRRDFLKLGVVGVVGSRRPYRYLPNHHQEQTPPFHAPHAGHGS